MGQVKVEGGCKILCDSVQVFVHRGIDTGWYNPVVGVEPFLVSATQFDDVREEIGCTIFLEL